MLTIEKKSLKVGKYVDTKHVDTVIRNYKQERWVHNSERIGKEDSLSVWYSVEELEEFIEKVKENGGDGIKFHFAAYPKEYAERPGYAGRQTIVLIATKSKETENGIVNKDIYIGTDKNSTVLAYNAGWPCPPCSGGKSGDVGGDSEWGGIGVIIDIGCLGTTILDRGKDGTAVI